MAVTPSELERARCPVCGEFLVKGPSGYYVCPDGLEHTKLERRTDRHDRVVEVAELPIATKTGKHAVYQVNGRKYGRCSVGDYHWPGEIAARTEFKNGWTVIRLVPIPVKPVNPDPWRKK